MSKRTRGWCSGAMVTPPRRSLNHSLKEMIAAFAIVSPALQAAFLESGGQSRMDKGRYGQVFPTDPCRHGPSGSRLSRGSRKGILCGACYCARKEDWLVFVDSCMIFLLGTIDRSTTGRLRGMLGVRQAIVPAAASPGGRTLARKPVRSQDWLPHIESLSNNDNPSLMRSAAATAAARRDTSRCRGASIASNPAGGTDSYS